MTRAPPTSLTNRSSSRNTAKVKKPADGEVCFPRVWEGVVTLADKYASFLSSDTHILFKELHENLKISFPIFCELICGCVKNPTMESCVDVVLSGAEEAIRAASGVLQNSKDIRKMFAECKCAVHNNDSSTSTTLDQDFLVTSNVYDYICGACCPAKKDPHLVCGKGDDEMMPKFISTNCVNHGKGKHKLLSCDSCGIRKRYNDLTCCPIWKDVALNGTKTNTIATFGRVL